MQGTSDDDKYEEQWIVKINTGGEYQLSKLQATILQQEISSGNRGIILFKTFSISIPYIAEFYMDKRFLRNALTLPEKATEPEYIPIPEGEWKKIREEIHQKLGKGFPQG
ncbi:MAG: hypothetical protein A2V69_01090 [Candidatus Portnoybacteria bacterium RBG_13_40_8]|uniref:Uncharacterized protein n=1 Tax=Candidatus Portnoybacteria bacterium RBG_13_40_8 TaxID=1801990 RepID=A0A1G2F2H6_9BACT|nr:MAG: hypothetical protein A2V69_01090 [Candidatus Portnoybacteria bacterium RBG_13_40_8]